MNEKLSVVGKRLPRVDAIEKATGEAKYTVDLRLPGMLYCKILRSPHAHARIVRIDTSKAEKLPGVKAFLTYKEARIPYYNDPSGNDEYVLGDKVRYVGDKVAAVAALSEEIAEKALELIDVEYEVLPAVFDPEEAMRPGAPQIHPERPLVKNNIVLSEIKAPPTICARMGQVPGGPSCIIEIGDIEKGFKEADYIFEDRYKTSRQCHCCAEPHTCIAKWESEKLTVFTSTQGAFPQREKIARTLNIPLNKVRVIVPPAGAGGGFGSKYGKALDVICALLSKKTGRPVKFECTREEEFHTTITRHPWVIYIKTGVKEDGTLRARQMKAILNAGAYHGGGSSPGILIALAGGWKQTIYKCPNIKFEAFVVYTNNPVAGAFRGFGNPQQNFALESQMDDIAEKLEMDPLEIRLKNIARSGDVNPYNKLTYTSCGLEECILKGAKRIGWKLRQKRPVKFADVKKRGMGMAIVMHVSGGQSFGVTPCSSAIVKVNLDGTINLLIGRPEIGQGGNTVLAQIAAEELGVHLEDVSVTAADTDVCPFDELVAGSTTTTITGGAVQAAAADAKQQLLNHAAKMLGSNVENLVAKDRKIYVRGSPTEVGVPISEVVENARSQAHAMAYGFKKNPTVIIGRGIYAKLTGALPFGAHFAEVEVNTETGQVKVLKMVAAHDVGRAINPIAVEGQIEGGLQQGIGYALTEDLVIDETTGRPLNPHFIDYKTLRANDMPEIEVIIVEPIDPVTPVGQKGVGELAMVPAASAIANAIYNATGLRIKELPMTPENIFKAWREKNNSAHAK